ncbi:MAG: HAMP domain-containing histidine kinase [Chitinophagales bacterium]|nr:HAMP domain-containing histidine kinase [Chitinophagales bacterium]
MKTLWLALIIVLSLTGLMAVQLQWLYKGMLSEKASFDREMNGVLVRIGKHIEDDSRLRNKIFELHHSNKGSYTNDRDTTSSVYLVKIIDSLFAQYLGETALYTSWGITESYLNYLLVEKAGYDYKEVPIYRSYTYRLEGAVKAECQCDIFLRLQVEGLFGLIAKRLYPLIIPTIAFVLMMILCLLLLVRGFRQQRKLVVIKNDFINNLAHELKTPVFSMSLLSRLLKSSLTSGDDEKSAHYLQLIEAENASMKEHVEKVLELAEFQGSRYELQLEPVLLKSLLDKIVEAFQYRAIEMEGQLIYEPSFDEDVKLQIDKIHFRNAIQNLLDNALKYGGRPPEVKLTVEVEKGICGIVVQDNGHGLTAKERRKIFRKFYRSRSGTRKNIKGFGIGLNYTREVVKAHKGNVWVKSTVGEGSSFGITMPT